MGEDTQDELTLLSLMSSRGQRGAEATLVLAEAISPASLEDDYLAWWARSGADRDATIDVTPAVGAA